MRNAVTKLAVAVFFSVAGSLVVAEPQSEQKVPEFSEAENLLWMNDHLKNVGNKTNLTYGFEKAGSLEEGFKDSVELTVTAVNDDKSRNVEFNFFTGDRHLALEPRQRVTGNQVIAIYLDGDLHEMHRLAKGSRPYFQRQLKLAFANSAKIEDVTVQFNGKKLPAKKVTVTPFESDPKRSMFQAFADKVYEFTLSDQIPGALYQIHTMVPDKARKSKGQIKPLVEETLTLKDVSTAK